MDVEAANPWLSACQTPAEAAEAAGSDVAVPVWGFDPGIPVAGTGYLPVVASPARAGVCLVGAHEAQIYIDLLLCFLGFFTVSSDGVY